MKKINNKVKQVASSYVMHSKRCAELESLLIDKVDFVFSIDFREDDGLVLCYNETSDLAILSNCLNEIEQNGRLTIEGFNKWSI